LGGNVYDIANLQATASWDLDLFGKHRAALDAAVGQTRAAQADAQAARLLIASQVVRAYFSLGRLQAQNVSLQRSLAQREQLLSLVQERVKAGIDTQLELSVSSASIPEVRQMLESNLEQQALTRNALAALSGQAASNISSAKLPMASSQTLADTPAIPIDLLGRRADIAASQWRINAALGDIQNAKSQFYPNINLVAFTGLNSLGFDRLMNTGSDQWGVGPAIRLPLFDAGRLKAQLRGKTADLDAAVESYNALVLEAVREVADQIASAKGIALQTTQQQAALSHAQNAYGIAQQRYQAGLGNYLTVLNLETAVLTQQRQAIDLAARAADTQVQMIRALGGGFTPETP
jgi:NodT family efflux transporter outer membrane factor (OMF) lipoprotein